MVSITHIDHQEATALALADRSAFDAEYNAWLAEDHLDGTPDYTDHFKDVDDLLSATLGDTRVHEINSLAEEALANDDVATCDTLEDGMKSLFETYSKAFGSLPK